MLNLASFVQMTLSEIADVKDFFQQNTDLHLYFSFHLYLVFKRLDNNQKDVFVFTW